MKKKIFLLFGLFLTISLFSNKAKAINVTTSCGITVMVSPGNTIDTEEFIDWGYNDLDEIICGN